MGKTPRILPVASVKRKLSECRLATLGALHPAEAITSSLSASTHVSFSIEIQFLNHSIPNMLEPLESRKILPKGAGNVGLYPGWRRQALAYCNNTISS